MHGTPDLFKFRFMQIYIVSMLDRNCDCSEIEAIPDLCKFRFMQIHIVSYARSELLL